MTQHTKRWSEQDYKEWKSRHSKKRSYQEEVLAKIERLSDRFNVSNYGELNYEDGTYPLFKIISRNIDTKKPNILITGGVHGYETSGTQGALAFMEEQAQKLEEEFNFVCYPCISPWGYETINRWNPDAIDPNRNFREDSPAKECSLILDSLRELSLDFLAHFDLHETTDTDNTVFRPDLEKRDGVPQELWEIPDGFYLVGDTSRREDEFQKAIINEVEKITHIAPTDQNGKIIGVDITSKGVINYDVKKLNLCAGLTDAQFVTTTEVYPDSPKVTAKECNDAQVAAVLGGLKYLASRA